MFGEWAAANPGVPSGAVTNVKGGTMLPLLVQETIFHPGYYRVALARTMAQLPPDPMVTTADTGRGMRSQSATIQNPPLAPVLLLLLACSPTIDPSVPPSTPTVAPTATSTAPPPPIVAAPTAQPTITPWATPVLRTPTPTADPTPAHYPAPTSHPTPILGLRPTGLTQVATVLRVIDGRMDVDEEFRR